MTRWLRSIIIILALLQAGWMTFDGAHAFVTGDYVTTASGEHAGQLGPWSKLVQVAGIEPRSTMMKAVLVIYGVAWLIIISSFAQNQSGAWWAMLFAAIGTLWYLPVGTVSSVIQIVLLIALRRAGDILSATMSAPEVERRKRARE